MEQANPPSLADLRAQSERGEQAMLRRRRELTEQVITARDDWGLVEVKVNGHGDVIEVAIDADLMSRVEPIDVAEAMLDAARTAQLDAKAHRNGRKSVENKGKGRTP